MSSAEVFDFEEDNIQTIYSVSELNQLVREVLEETFPFVWLEGEISNFVRPASGHMYFSLKDSQAQIRCAMFKMQNMRLKFQPENGMQVLVRARVSLYPERGDFQLIIEHLQKAGEGELQRAFEALKQKLAQEGLFDEKYKKALPAFPRTIGVITSPTGAAIRDILSVLKRRAPYLSVIIYPTQVQGEAAASQLIAAIHTANQRQECDVLILARGGGSLEDLAPFNDEQLARAILGSFIPIVTGVGHEIDFSIADFVADRRAPTPSAAAELISPDQQESRGILQRFTQQLILHMRHILQAKQHQLTALEKSLQHPAGLLEKYSMRRQVLEQQLLAAMQRHLQKCEQALAKSSEVLNAVSPLATLARGYAIVMDQQKQVIDSINKVSIGQNIKVHLREGLLDCTVDRLLS